MGNKKVKYWKLEILGPPIKIVVIAHRGEKHKPEDFVPHLESETKRALTLFAEKKSVNYTAAPTEKMRP